jgi:hypothetical protein
MFIIINVNRNHFLVKSLHLLRKRSQTTCVDFLQQKTLTRIRVAFRTKETKVEGVIRGWSDWLVLGVSSKTVLKAGFFLKWGTDFAKIYVCTEWASEM